MDVLAALVGIFEYNFMGFGTRSATVVGCGGICAFSGKADIQNVLAGVNYKF